MKKLLLLLLVFTYNILVAQSVSIKLENNSKNNINVVVEVFDLGGKLIQFKNYNLVIGDNEININTEYLSRGVYIIRIRENNKILKYKKILFL